MYSAKFHKLMHQYELTVRALGMLAGEQMDLDTQLLYFLRGMMKMPASNPLYQSVITAFTEHE